jgi:hypothetical protein
MVKVAAAKYRNSRQWWPVEGGIEPAHLTISHIAIYTVEILLIACGSYLLGNRLYLIHRTPTSCRNKSRDRPTRERDMRIVPTQDHHDQCHGSISSSSHKIIVYPVHHGVAAPTYRFEHLYPWSVRPFLCVDFLRMLLSVED